jgi:glyoxylase-like metal-dependent hydrolase (beta-lactamase superfamily II)
MAQPVPAERFLIEPSEEISPIAPDVVCISCPVPFDVGTVNVYVLLGDPLTLIDTGSRVGFDIDDLDALLQRADVELAEIQQLVLTHRHIDHFGLAHQVQARSGCVVVSSTVDGPFMEQWEGMVAGSRAQLMAQGKAFGIPAELFEMAEKSFRHIAAAAEPIKSDRLVREGEEIVAGGRKLRVIECPGHTEGLITLLDDSDGTYFANDHILRHITPNPDVYSYKPDNLRSGLPDYVNSLHKVRGLPARLVLPGHGHEMTDLAARVDEILLHHDERADKVLALVKDQPATIFDLVGKVWENLPPQSTHLAVREIIGHLVLLERAGLVHHHSEDGALIYVAT